MSVPHTVSGGGTVDLPGSVDARAASSSNPNVGEAGAHSPWKISRTIAAARACGSGREIPTAPQRIVVMGIDHRKRSLHTTRESCDGQRGLDDHEGMTTHPEYTLAKPSTCLNNRDHFTYLRGSGIAGWKN